MKFIRLMKAYMKRLLSHKRIILVIVFSLLVITSLRIGVLDLTFSALFKGDAHAWEVLWISRIPRTVAIILSASALSIAGLIMQAISRNKFVAPSTAGTTNAAVLGLLIGFLLFGNQTVVIRTVFAFAFALVSSIIFILMLNRIQFKNIIYVPLVGMMYGAMIAAISTFIAYQFNALQFIQTIGVGGFANKAIGTYELLFLVIPVIVLAFIYATRFSIVGMGEDFAKNLGVNYKFVIALGLIIISAITAVNFVMVGHLPFIGLIIPNLVTMYYGDGVKKNMVDVALFGSSFVLINDIISRVVIFPYEVAISFTMGILGALIFLIIIYRRMSYDKA